MQSLKTGGGAGSRRRSFFFALAVLLAPAAHAADLSALAETREWRRLIHHHWTSLGRRGEPVAEGFFLAPRGRWDAQAELEATLAAFSEPAELGDRHAQCRFPLRLAFLRERLGLEGLPSPDCRGLSLWRKRVDADAVSLVFADGYINNPASMYGHTFLILHRRGNGDPLLDMAVNFAADADTKNGVLFALYGLGGVFPGRYSAMPYYLKVQEYSNLESRDLWEYRLALSSEAIARLTDHLWELGDARFPYFFFNKNCSYQLLPLLEAAEPSLELLDGWPLYVIPSDTVRVLKASPGLVRSRAYRPSHVSRMLTRRATLTRAELDGVERLSDPAVALSTEAAPSPRRALMLASASEYLQYRIDYRRDPPPGLAIRQHDVHVQRSGLGLPPEDTAVPEPAAPEAGHRTARVSVAAGSQDERAFTELSVRAAMHDVLDRTEGYAPGQGLEMLGFTLRQEQEAARVYLEAVQFVRIVSLSPMDRWIRRPSWKLDFGLRTARTGLHPSESLTLGLSGGTGLSWRTRVGGRHTFYSMVEFDSGAGKAFEHDYRAGLGAGAGALLEPAPRWRMGLEARWLDYPLGDGRAEERYSVQTAFDLTKEWAVRLSWERRRASDELTGAVQWHF